MDLVALTLIASSVLVFIGAILAGFIFAPWVMAFGALGLLALLPRNTNWGTTASNSSALSNGSTNKGAAPQEARSNTPPSSSEPGSNHATQPAQLPLTTLQYRGNFYKSAIGAKATALQQTASNDR